jgi:hypothetical protein
MLEWLSVVFASASSKCRNSDEFGFIDRYLRRVRGHDEPG